MNNLREEEARSMAFVMKSLRESGVDFKNTSLNEAIDCCIRYWCWTDPSDGITKDELISLAYMNLFDLNEKIAGMIEYTVIDALNGFERWDEYNPDFPNNPYGGGFIVVRSDGTKEYLKTWYGGVADRYWNRDDHYSVAERAAVVADYKQAEVNYTKQQEIAMEKAARIAVPDADKECIERLCEHYYLTLDRGRNGKEYAYYLDENYCHLVDVESLDVIDDEEFIEEQFA